MEEEAENTQDRMARTRGKGSFKQITIFLYVIMGTEGMVKYVHFNREIYITILTRSNSF